jgi:hypothetical protein
MDNCGISRLNYLILNSIFRKYSNFILSKLLKNIKIKITVENADNVKPDVKYLIHLLSQLIP